jgi:hypothetical protein
MLIIFLWNLFLLSGKKFLQNLGLQSMKTLLPQGVFYIYLYYRLDYILF